MLEVGFSEMRDDALAEYARPFVKFSSIASI
jgi:hypothetical protein